MLNNICCVLLIGLIIGSFIGMIFNEYFFNDPITLSDEELYYKILDEFEYYMKISGLFEKKVSEIRVHVDNHNESAIFEIQRFRRMICNETV